MEQIRKIPLKAVGKKYLSPDTFCLVGYLLLVIVGIWLAVVTYVIRDVLFCLVFMMILLALHTTIGILLYRKVHRPEKPRIQGQDRTDHLAGLAATQIGGDGVRLLLPERR